MVSKSVWQKGLSFVGGGITAVLFVAPGPAHAGIFDIFSFITSTITDAIGGPLASMMDMATTAQSDMQSVLFPVSSINQSLGFVTTTISGYRGWMSTVFTMPSPSGQLPATQLVELESMSGLQGPIADIQGTFDQIDAGFMQVNGPVPTAQAAPQANRQMVDMADAISKDGLAQSVIGDQSAASLITMANGIESQAAASAPGTATMLAASAKASELMSLAGQHKLLAAMLRGEAAELANQTAETKQAVAQTQQFNQTITNTVAAN